MKIRRRVRPLTDIGERLFMVEKPSRYLGGEAGSIQREGDAAYVMALCFPDLYEIGMSNNAMRILYNDLNALPGLRCERVFAPAPDFEALLKDLRLPLYTLEGGIALCDVDLLGFTIGYELAATSLLSVLASGGIPLRAAERNDSHPIVIAGGPAISNPGTLGLFIDAAWIGEAEAGFYELVGELAAMKGKGLGRREQLERMAREPAIWMPGTSGGAPKKALRAIYDGFSEKAYDTATPIPTLRPVQEHGTVEIMRGCPNGCRFCHAGYYYRPQRLKRPEKIRQEVANLVERGGHREITLASLSSGDYEGISELIQDLNATWGPRGISFQLPSLKVNSFTLPLIEALSTVRKAGLTFAVETPEDAWQRILNKDVSFEKTLAILREAKSRGFRLAKFYFMIGLPVPERGQGEVDAILAFFDRLAAERLGMSFNVNVGTFVPKPHTPFQWCSQLGEDEALAAIHSLRSGMRQHRNVKLSWHSPFVSCLEGILSRGDARVGELILEAFNRGARLDAWEDRFDRELWRSVLEDSGWDPIASFMGARNPADELAWDSVAIRVSKSWLLKEYERSLAGTMLSACEEKCTAPCGSCSDEAGLVQKTSQLAAAGPALAQPPALPCARLVLAFEKRGVASFIPHLGIVEALSRAIMMLNLPASYSEGFNPMPRLELSAPLSMGVESREELAVLMVTERLEETWGGPALPRLIAALNEKLPEGLRILRASDSALLPGRRVRSIGALSWGSCYQVRPQPDSNLTLEALRDRLTSNLTASSIAEAQVSEEGDGGLRLLLPDSTKKGQGLQPVLTAALNGLLEPEASPRSLIAYSREACLGRNPEGKLISLFDLLRAESLSD